LADLADGFPLSSSLAKYPRIFDSFLTSIIAVGEESGSLSGQLLYLAIQLEKKQELTSKVRGALFYPLVVMTGALGVGTYLAFFLLPKLLPLFNSLHIELPITTRILLAFSKGLLLYWMWVGGGLILAVIIGIVLWQFRPIKHFGHRMLLAMPIFGRLVRDIQLVQINRVLGTLLKSGLQIVPALKVTSASVSNLVYVDALDETVIAVERGETLASTLKGWKRLFPGTAVSMIGVGERTGSLPRSLLAMADFSEREVDNLTKNLSALIEPLLLLILGVVVGFVALSIITPIYQLTQGMTR